MERLTRLFPAAQLRVLTAEALRTDPAAALADVRGFLGLRPAPASRPREAHVGVEMDYPSQLTAEDAAHLRRVYAADDARLFALTGVRYGEAG